jgi:uncharacterized protein YdeI (YjbR/CyaY-like superfamily)
MCPAQIGSKYGMPPTFFATAAEFRDWLARHHDTADELLVGFWKRGSGKPSMTWPESVDQALCFGWIDGIRKRLDDESYTIRFTPRRRGSVWSAVNSRRAQELIDAGLMQPSGLAAFEQRKDSRSQTYSYENKPKALPREMEKTFRANKRAWSFFEKQPPGYQRMMLFYVLSAKREETRARRLEKLIAESERQRRML